MRRIFKRQRRSIAQNRKPHREVGLSHYVNFGLAALLTLLTTLAGPRRLLLLLLTRFLLAAALLLTALLLTALLLAALLLLTRLLVWILIHLTVLSNIGSKRHLDRSRPMARDNAWRLHSFPFTHLVNFDENVFGTRWRQHEFPHQHNGGANDGTLYVAVAAWGANSDSRVGLVVRWAALNMPAHAPPA